MIWAGIWDLIRVSAISCILFVKRHHGTFNIQQPMPAERSPEQPPSIQSPAPFVWRYNARPTSTNPTGYSRFWNRISGLEPRLDQLKGKCATSLPSSWANHLFPLSSDASLKMIHHSQCFTRTLPKCLRLVVLHFSAPLL